MMGKQMNWSYKTVHFELKKEGLLGGSFLDETELEEQLNDFGRSGWELVSVIEVQNGLIAFFKQSINIASSRLRVYEPAALDEQDEPEDPLPEERPYFDSDSDTDGGHDDPGFAAADEPGYRTDDYHDASLEYYIDETPVEPDDQGYEQITEDSLAEDEPEDQSAEDSRRTRNTIGAIRIE